MAPETKQDIRTTLKRPSAPASGCFGYTRAHLAAPRSCTMEAELFARFYLEAAERPARQIPPKSG